MNNGSNVAKHKTVFRGRQVQIQTQHSPAVRFLHHRSRSRQHEHRSRRRLRRLPFTTDRSRSVPPHVSPQGLPDRELQPTYGTLVRLRLGRRRWAFIGHEPGLLVAGAVASQRLERLELPVAGFALEHAARRVPASAGGGQHDQGIGHACYVLIYI